MRLRAWLLLALVAVAMVAVPGGIAAPSPIRAADPPVAVDLYRAGDFVSQTNLVQCVGASMQMMTNMIGPSVDRSAATQQRLFRLAQELGGPSLAGRIGPRGASATGWAAGLTTVGAGPYRVVPIGSFDAAVTLAARAIATTGRPVGLLVWQGVHAWVMSGFEASADPSRDPTATVTAIRVLDPLYPRAGGSWGATPVPDARLAPAQLRRVFVPYRPHGRNLALRSQFVLVLPYDAPQRAGFGRMVV